MTLAVNKLANLAVNKDIKSKRKSCRQSFA